MDKKEEFKHYMLAGHGRAAMLLKNSGENFRDVLLYGCLNDISFDMQCEGSRGYYMYNLVWEYGENKWFLEKAVEKFLTNDINNDWHTICHLCDFIRLFWEYDEDKTARSAIEKKYCELYSEIMTKENASIDCFEYLSITLMQIEIFKIALKIFRDIGEYFLKCEETCDEDLKLLFGWFYDETKEKYGEDFLKEELEKHGKDSEEIRRFNRVLNTPDKHFEKKERPSPTAKNLVKKDNSKYLLETLIYNCRESDRDIIFNHLNSLEIDIDSESGWHSVMFKIIDTAEEIVNSNTLLNDLLMFAYEKSLCSCCRENIVDELAKRNLMSGDMIAECRFDSNSEIRKKIDVLNKNSFTNS